MDGATPEAREPGEAPPVRWALRAAQVGATPADPGDGVERLVALWTGGRLAEALDGGALRRVGRWLQFARIGAGRRVIEQDEVGDFMLVVLEGSIVVERVPTVGTTARLAEARPGDVVGDMALLDAGPRFSSCTTKNPCLVAVLEIDALARLMKEDAELALVLLVSLSRRLSLRLRQVSARLSALLADT
jgi:hypothetical protein